jgi:hypothetical protein
VHEGKRRSDLIGKPVPGAAGSACEPAQHRVGYPEGNLHEGTGNETWKRGNDPPSAKLHHALEATTVARSTTTITNTSV